MDKIDQLDLMQGKLLEAELEAAKAKVETKMAQFQSWMDSTWLKYGKVKGEDTLQLDGTWEKIRKPFRAGINAAGDQVE